MMLGLGLGLGSRFGLGLIDFSPNGYAQCLSSHQVRALGGNAAKHLGDHSAPEDKALVIPISEAGSRRDLPQARESFVIQR